MPEGVNAYPRWDGELSAAPRVLTVAFEEWRKARFNQWTQYAFVLVVAYTIVYLGQLYQLSNSRGDVVHTMENFVTFLNYLPWGALGIAAVMSGPALLEDARHGALELYLSRAVTMPGYLAGKVLAVLGATWLAIAVPALLYFGASFVFFEAMPEGWNWVWAKALGWALMWALLATGLGLGLSCVARSSRAASILLFGGFVVADIVIANLLEAITRHGAAKLLSPIAAVRQQQEWIFGVDAPFDFPTWWGLLEWAALVVLGWALVAWKHPRLRGV